MTIREKAPHILVVDDDQRIRELLQRFLTENGFRASTAKDSANARQLLASVEFDLLILDVMMPGMSGVELTERIRAASNVPVLLLTARGLPQDRIEGLEMGADDYMSKPFEPRELLLRVASLLRRTRREPSPPRALAFGRCVFDAARGELRRDGEPVKLTAAELSLLRVLSDRPGEAVARQRLVELTSSGMERSVDVQVTRLRRKMEDDPRTPIYLQTVRGVGYALMPDA